MTQNAAALLAKLLQEYEVPKGSTTEATRGFESIDDLGAWRRQYDAAHLMSLVDDTLQGMAAGGEDITMFSGALPRWYAGVFMASTPWGQRPNSNVAACGQGDIDLPKALGLLIRSGAPVILTEDDRRSLSDVLQHAQELLEANEQDMPDDVRRYLHGLICRARMIVDNIDMYGHEAVRQVALELGGAFTLQAERAERQGDPQSASKWRSAATTLTIGFMGGFGGTTGGAIAAGAGTVIKQLTSGG